MEVNKTASWIARWAQSKWGEQSPYVVPPMIQPTLKADWEWPIHMVPERIAGTLAAAGATTTLLFFPGKANRPTSYPSALRHHALYRWMTFEVTVAKAVDLFIFHGADGHKVTRLYNGAAATEHFPFLGVLPDQRLIQYPYELHLRIYNGLAETYTVHVDRFDLPDSEPLPY